MTLSVVTTIYKSEQYLNEFLELVLSSINELSIESFELLFVLDGITDNSKELLLKKKSTIPQISILELSRNFGHHYAASAGLSNAIGEYVFLIDCDLEVSPTVMVEFMGKMNNSDADVVYGVQKSRKGKFIEKQLGGLFWKVFNLLSDTKVPNNVVTERLMNRNYLDALNSLGDKNIFFAGLMYWVGFKQVGLEVEKGQRNGKSTYGIIKRMSLLVEAITSFSEKPLKLIFKFGLAITAMSFTIIILLTLRKLLYPETLLLGFTTIISTIFLSLGLLTSSIGLMGIYLSRIFKQVQDRPKYIIKKRY